MDNIKDINDIDLDTVPIRPVCIIGSGAAGGTLALALAKKNIPCLILEKGGLDNKYGLKDSVENIDFFGADQGDNYNRSVGLGGSSVLWAGRTACLEESDFSNWPFSYNTMKYYYEQASKIMGMPLFNKSIHPTLEKHCDNLFDKSVMENKAFIWSHKPYNLAEELYSFCKKSEHIKILYNANVNKILLDQAGRVHAVSVRKDHKDYQIEAGCFVLAAGGIENARLMLLSNDTFGSGIGNNHDLVGRYLSTHPKGNLARIILNKRICSNTPLLQNVVLNTQASMRLGIGWRQGSKSYDLNHYIQPMVISEYYSEKLFGSIIKQKDFLDNLSKFTLLKRNLPGIGRSIFEISEKLSLLTMRPKSLNLRFFLDQYPDPNNRVSLGDEKDEAGLPKVHINWKFSSNDKLSVISMIESLDTHLRRSNLGVIESNVSDNDNWPIAKIHSHFMGTTRMASDERDGVVDADGLVYGTKNLYVAGPSLFPSYGFANPFLTIVALSLKLSDRLERLVER